MHAMIYGYNNCYLNEDSLSIIYFLIMNDATHGIGRGTDRGNEVECLKWCVFNNNNI